MNYYQKTQNPQKRPQADKSKQTDPKMRWGEIGSRITSAPTGLFGSHYAFSDTVPGKSLSSDVLFIFVQTNMALRKYTCFSSPVWSYRRNKNRRGSGASLIYCMSGVSTLSMHQTDLNHGGGIRMWRSGCLLISHKSTAPGCMIYPSYSSKGNRSVKYDFVSLVVVGGAYYTVEYR